MSKLPPIKIPVIHAKGDLFYLIYLLILCFFTGITKLMLDRHPVNSLDTEFLKRIGAVLDDLEETKSKGMVLSSVCCCTIF